MTNCNSDDEWPDEMTAEDYLKRINGKNGTGSGRPSSSKKAKRATPNWLEQLLLHLRAHQLPEPLLEFQFHKERRWRFDLAWPDILLAVEIDGGVWGNPVYCNHCRQAVTRNLHDGRIIPIREGGRHNRGEGYENDRIKYAEAGLLGWLVIGLTPNMIENGMAIDLILRAFEIRRIDPLHLTDKNGDNDE